MNIVPSNDVQESDFVLLRFGLDLYSAGKHNRLQKPFDQFFRSFMEIFAAEMLYDHIHIGLDGTAHVQRLLVNLRNRYGMR